MTTQVQEAVEKFNSAGGELVLDFASVPRIDAAGVSALQDLAGRADERSVKVVLRGVNMEVYRVLKLLRLTDRFSFAA